MSKNVNIKYKFYEVCCLDQNKNECNYDLSQWISHINNLKLEDVIKDINGITGRLESTITLEDKFYAFNFMRLDSLSNTYKVKETTKAQHIDLEDDEYIGKNTVVLYDPALNLVMIQNNRGGFGEFSISSYINSFGSHPDCYFKPCLNNYNLNDCKKYPTKKIDIRFSNIETIDSYNSRDFEAIMAGMKKFEGVTAHIEIGLGRSKRGGKVEDALNPEVVYEVSQVLRKNKHAISSARLTIDDEMKSHIIDLFENVESEIIPFKIPERGELAFQKMAEKMLLYYKKGTRKRISQ